MAPLLALALAGAAAAACSPVASTSPLQADPPAERAEEMVLGTEIRKDLLVQLGRDAWAIDVDADTDEEGRVVLSSVVRSADVQQLAVQIASESATEVVDRLRVDPGAAPEPSVVAKSIREADLEVAVMIALLDRMGPDAAEIAVEVDDAVVTLLGEVDEAKDRDVALAVARQQQGVAEVRDDLDLILSEG